MTERASEQEDHFNLLPFIAILMCVLGTELLVTMSMATVSLGTGLSEGWVPTQDPNRPTKNPILIEWDGKTAIIHADAGRFEIGVTFPKSGSPPELEEFFKSMTARRLTDYALIAVRPSGFENYFRLVNELKERKIDYGLEPVEQGKPVRIAKGAPK